MTDRLRKLVSRLRKDTRGGVAIMLGLLIPVVFVGVGGAVDYTKSVTNTQKAQRTMDSVVLALTRLDPETLDVQATGQQMFNAGIAASGLDGMSYDVTFSLNGEEITGAAVVENKTFFLGYIGIQTIDGAVQAAALPPARRPIEIALALDVSGSMGKNLNGSSRIQQMITAVNEMFDTLDEELPDGTELSASLVPYSSSVNLSNFRNALENSSLATNQALPNNGNVWAAERVSASNGNDYTLLDNAPNTNAIPFVTGLEMSYSRPFARLSALDDDIDDVRSRVNALNADGWTAGHLGMIWGLYTLSPEWDNFWPKAPAEYDEADKIIVLLSDGEFNTTYNIGDSLDSDVEYGLIPQVYATLDNDDDDDDDDGNCNANPNGNAFGFFSRCTAGNDDEESREKTKEELKQEILRTQNDNAEESNAYFQNACALARNNDITIYAIALSDGADLDKLTECVGSSGILYTADTASQLSNAFKNIARKLSERRLAS